MPNINMRDLRPGDKVTLLFHGSKQYGNEPWEEETTFFGFETDFTNGELYAKFADGWQAYRINNKGTWRYGSSAERLSIIALNR